MSSHRQCWQFKRKMLSLQHPWAHLWPYYVSGLFRIPSLLLFQTKSLSRWTDQWDRPMATSATEGPAGAGSTVALPREAMCWQGPLQPPLGAFWRALARAGAQCLSWTSGKSNSIVAPKMGSSLECHLPRERETLWHWSTRDSLRTSAPQSLWLPPSKECLIPTLFVSCNQNWCKAVEEIYSCFQNCPQPVKASLSLWDTMLDTTEGTYELHGWLALTQKDTSESPGTAPSLM